MKKIVILGSTGSIGRSALEVIEKYGGRFRVAGLAASRNHEVLYRQAMKFKPGAVALSDPAAASVLRGRLKKKIPVYSGAEGLRRIARMSGADFVLSCIVGFAGMMPTLEAVRAGKTVGLANKEALVTAGEILKREAARCGARIIPVDSEHSAVFQCLEGRAHSVKQIILTASGGPFAGKNRKELDSVNLEEALNHPRWKMGRKITIDSATLMNKGLEVIEAHHLFAVPPEKIKVLVHPQSIVHSLVEFVDGTMLAQLSRPDMKAPIAYALSCPERLPGVIQPLELRGACLDFREPDVRAFPCLALAYRALARGGTMPAVLNAANESAVEAFLSGRLGFNDIPDIIRKTMALHRPRRLDEIDAVVEADGWARVAAGRFIERRSKRRSRFISSR